MKLLETGCVKLLEAVTKGHLGALLIITEEGEVAIKEGVDQCPKQPLLSLAGIFN